LLFSIKPVRVGNGLYGIPVKVMAHRVHLATAEIITFRMNICADSATKSSDACIRLEERRNLLKKADRDRTDRITDLSR